MSVNKALHGVSLRSALLRSPLGTASPPLLLFIPFVLLQPDSLPPPSPGLWLFSSLEPRRSVLLPTAGASRHRLKPLWILLAGNYLWQEFAELVIWSCGEFLAPTPSPCFRGGRERSGRRSRKQEVHTGRRPSPSCDPGASPAASCLSGNSVQLSATFPPVRDSVRLKLGIE